jgi:microcystin-dependent protein
MTQPYIATIQPFAFPFAPKNWALCNGQMMAISQNSALFSLVGTMYGGNGVSTFGLPNAQSRTLVHWGQGNGLSPYQMGQVTGSQQTTLSSNNLPTHTHALNASTVAATKPGPQAEFLATANGQNDTTSDAVAVQIYGPTPGSVALAPTMQAGNSMPINLLQPLNTVNFCIALFGLYPSRN